MSEASPAPTRKEQGHLVESARPLSESMLWRVQDQYYEQKAIRAWASGEVPHVLTTGPMLARTYAQLISSFADDCAAGRFGRFDPDLPIYIVELGAGTGRLGFEISLALGRERPAPCRLVYVLTDLVEENVAFWKTHPKLAPAFAAGSMDAARFVVGADDVLRLDGAGVTLGPGEVVNPIVLVSNYLFDVLPQDGFESVGGELYEEEVALYARMADVGPETPDFFRDFFVAPHRVPVRRERYEPDLEALLFEVAKEDAADRRFLFPADGVRGLRALAALSGGRLLHLIGERPGRVPERRPDPDLVAAAIEADPELPNVPAAIDGAGTEAIRPGALLAMGVHGGSMSLPVEVPILVRSLNEFGAEFLVPPALPTGLLVCAIVAGATADPVEIRLGFTHAVADLGPEDVYLTVKSALDHPEQVSPAFLFAALRTGGYEPYLLREVFEELEKQMKDIDELAGAEAERVLRQVFEHDFPLDDTIELAYPIGILLARAERIPAALEFFERSVARSGPRAATSFNIALCRLHLEQPEAALRSLAEAIELDPTYEPARVLADQVRSEQGRRSPT